ncbi:MAG: NosD domain-containing protein [Candidatus Bathyarchaeia archaeon]|jgi:hypothetical protein
MNKKTLSVIFVVLLMVSISLTVFTAPVSGEDTVIRHTILIQENGKILPADTPIQIDGDTYTLLQDIYDPILIEKSNITFNGAGHALIGPLTEKQHKYGQVIGWGPDYEETVPYIIGIDVNDDVSGVTIKGLNVCNFSIGAYLRSQENSLYACNIYNNIVGVLLSGSGNHVTYNNITGNQQGLFFGFESTGEIANIPSDILISHNSFISNNQQLSGCVCKDYNLEEERHSWDDGKEGNYWSDYTGTDKDGDGIGDTPYVVDILNQDSYPLMQNPLLPQANDAPLTIELILVAVFVPIIAILVASIVLKIRKQRQ